MAAEDWLELDSALRERLREVLADPERPLTEAELRGLADEGRACSLILNAELERLERTLGELDRDASTSLGAIADAFRHVHDFRAHVEELNDELAALDDRAREVRTAWRRKLTERL
jgi:hypothetical protein